MMKFYIAIVSIAILALFIFVNANFIFVTPIHGRVIDSVTKKPLENISIQRTLEFAKCGLIQCNHREKNFYAKTDQNGEFYFMDRMISKDFRFSLEQDFLYINNNFENKNYYSSKKMSAEKGDTFGVYGDTDLAISLFSTGSRRVFVEPAFLSEKKGFKNYLIEWPPIVDKIEDCKNNQRCILYNGKYIAMKEKNEDLCLLIPSLIKYQCLQIIANIKRDKSICNKIEEAPNANPEFPPYGYYEKLDCPGYINRGEEMCNYITYEREKNVCYSYFQ